MPKITGTTMIMVQTTCEKTAFQRKKSLLLSTAALMVGAMLVPGHAMAGSATPTNSWDYDVVLDGNVGKDVSTAGLTNITVNGGNGYVAGNADIYTGHTVNVTGDSGATFAYKDNRNNIQSTLDGNLNSNMKVVIIDKDGLFFMNGSSVNVQSLVATTGNIRVNDVMNGGNVLTVRNVSEDGMIINEGTITAKKSVDLIAKGILNSGDIIVTKANGRILLAAANQLTLKRPSKKTSIDVSETGIVINLGTLTVAKGGLAAIVSPFSANGGVINAKMGTVAMASGETVTLDMYGDGLVEVAVDGELANTMIVNAGEIKAEGGKVQITAKAAKSTLDNVINNSGIITASSARVDGGKIILDSGEHNTIYNTGLIETSAGGSIEISAERFKQSEAIIVPPVKPSIGVKSFGGNIDITTTDNVEIYKGTVDAAGGNINIDNGGVFYSKNKDTILTSGVGTIDINQNQDAPLSAPAFARFAFAPVGPSASIQNVVDAISNTGTGTNTVNVSAGTFVEDVTIDQNNTILNGSNHGLGGADVTRGAETLIIATTNGNGVKIIADNVTVDGVAIDGDRAGVFVDGADNARVLNNVINNASYGVEVVDSSNSMIKSNIITDTTEGIRADDARGLWVYDNDIIGASVNGIHIENSDGTDYINDIDIWKNRINGAAGSTGILVENSDFASIGGYGNNQFKETDSLATGNVITGVQNGIVVKDSDNAIAIYNTLDGISGNGIAIYGSDDTIVVNNDIDNVGGGIIASEIGDITILNNNIKTTSRDGIYVNDFNTAQVLGNVVDGASDIGIYLNDGIQSNIIYNTVTNSDIGIASDDTDQTVIFGNNVAFSRDGGISAWDNGAVVIENNIVNESGNTGIDTIDTYIIAIANNTVSNSGTNGVLVGGDFNGEVLFEGNILTDNGQDTGSAHARFESGNIDLSNLINPNIITNTTADSAIGLQFVSDGSAGSDSFEGQLVEFDGPKFAIDGPKFAIGNGLTIVGETLGATAFTGFAAADSFYVRFEDGAILDPITNAPITIDGTNASFDGIIPGSFAGEVLPVATLNFIENRLFDADDATVNGRGQIFVGTPSVVPGGPAALSNFQDFFFTPDGGVAPAGGASVRITGLPSTGPLSLNDIAPAAGEDNSGDDVANIEPAAGEGDQGNDVTCLGDALNSLGAGTVNYNFGGSLQDSIIGASACANAAL